MTKSMGDHVYRESGMDHVLLKNVIKYDCSNCGNELVQIERMAQLHRLLAELIVNKPARLIPSEIRFLRDHVGLSNRDFAVLLGVSESQASRWTSAKNPEQMNLAAEYFFRTLATAGPFTLASTEPATVRIVRLEDGKPKAIEAHPPKLPSRDTPQRELPFRVERTKSDWKEALVGAV